MQLIRDNPITAMFFAFFLTSCGFSYLPWSLRWMTLGMAVCALLILLIFKPFDPLTRQPLALISAACIASGLLISAAHLHADHLDSFAGETDQVTLKITETEYSLAYAAGYIAAVEESEFLPSGTRIRLYSSHSSLPEGAILEGEVELCSLSDGGFDGRSYYLPRRILLNAEEITLTHTDTRPVFSVTSLFRQFSERFTAMILANTSPQAGGLSSAVLLGVRDHLDEGMERDFRRLGISHLLVVSGTHFSVLVTMAGAGLKRLKIQPKLRTFINMLLILFLMLLTGMTSSVMRAGIMHLMAQLSRLLTRRNSLIHSFAFSGALMVLINPYSAMDCGLQLSFAATYCCLLFQICKGFVYRTIRQKTGIQPKKLPLIGVLETILCTCMVSLSTLPLIWQYFGEVSLISIPANVIFTPLISVLMLFTAAFLILYPLRILIPPMAALMNLFCAMLGKLAGVMANPDWVMIPVNYSFSVFFLLPLTVLLLLLPFLNKHLRIRAAAASASIGILFFAAVGIIGLADRNFIRFSYLPEKKNDGFVLKSDGKALICEMADGSFGYAYNLTDELAELHVCEIDTLLLTHYHNRHIQLVNRLSQREILRNLVLPEPIDDRERGIYETLAENAAARSISVTTVPSGGSLDFHGTAITLFERTYLSRSTHPVTAVEIDLGTEEIALLSCSFNQSVPEITDAAEMAEYVIFGNHSPVYKKTFGLSFASAPKALISGDDAYAHMDEPLRDLADDCSADVPWRLKVRRNAESTSGE